MKYLYFRSLFFIVVLILLSSCEKNPVSSKAQNSAYLKALLNESYDTSKTIKVRLAAVNKVLKTALNSRDSLAPYAVHSKLTLLQQNYPDSIQPFLAKYLHASKIEKDTFNLAVAEGLLAEHYLNFQKTDSAFYYFDKSKASNEMRKDSVHVVYALLQMAELYRQFNDYGALETTSVEARKFLNNPRDTIYNPTIYNNFGIASKHLMEYDDAIGYYKQVENMTGDSIKKIIAIGNIAAVHKMTKNYNEVARILIPLSKSNAIRNNAFIKGRLLSILGHSQIDSDVNEAISILKQSQVERQIVKDSLGLASTYNYLADAYATLDVKTAQNYARRSYEIATKRNSVDDRLDALRNLMTLSDNDTYRSTYFKVNDSITQVRQSARNQFAKIRYDASVEQQENQLLRTNKIENALESERHKFYIKLLVLATLLSIAMASIGFLIVKKRNKAKLKREGYITETRISKKVHDEFANDIYSTIAFTETEDLALVQNKEKLLQQLSQIYAHSRNISREYSPIATDESFSTQLRMMLSEYNSQNCSVIIAGIDDIPWKEISVEKKVATYRVLNELIVNMRKHSKAKIAAFRFSVEQEKVHILYSDNGIGFNSDVAIFKNGLLNVENRIEAIGGTITFETSLGNGVKIRISYSTKK